MATSTQGVTSVRQTGNFPLYNTTTDQFGKTVFTSPGRVVTVVFDTTDVTTGSNVAYNSTTGVFTLSAGITYQLTCTGRINNYTAPVSEPAALEWYNVTGSARIGDSSEIGSATITMFKPSVDSQVTVRAACSNTTLNYQWQYPAFLTRCTATVAAVSGWTE